MKAQSSMELFVTLGIILAFTLPMIFLLFTLTSLGYENTAKAQADATSRTIAESINQVYAQGNGAKKTVLINTPASTESIEIKSSGDTTGVEVLVTIRTANDKFTASAASFGRIKASTYEVGRDPKTDVRKAGLYSIIMENEDNEVKISVPD